ncbi:MAG: hypothetical protein M1812_004322 [Candelaria pacifica]|nr:MAG: hypothetical protein M1812_004322 [Candelaria pacifica]
MSASCYAMDSTDSISIAIVTENGPAAREPQRLLEYPWKHIIGEPQIEETHEEARDEVHDEAHEEVRDEVQEIVIPDQELVEEQDEEEEEEEAVGHVLPATGEDATALSQAYQETIPSRVEDELGMGLAGEETAEQDILMEQQDSTALEQAQEMVSCENGENHPEVVGAKEKAAVEDTTAMTGEDEIPGPDVDPWGPGGAEYEASHFVGSPASPVWDDEEGSGDGKQLTPEPSKNFTKIPIATNEDNPQGLDSDLEDDEWDKAGSEVSSIDLSSPGGTMRGFTPSPGSRSSPVPVSSLEKYDLNEYEESHPVPPNVTRSLEQGLTITDGMLPEEPTSEPAAISVAGPSTITRSTTPVDSQSREEQRLQDGPASGELLSHVEMAARMEEHRVKLNLQHQADLIETQQREAKLEARINRELRLEANEARLEWSEAAPYQKDPGEPENIGLQSQSVNRKSSPVADKKLAHPIGERSFDHKRDGRTTPNTLLGHSQHSFVAPRPENGLLSEADLAYYEANIQRLRSRNGLNEKAKMLVDEEPGSSTGYISAHIPIGDLDDAVANSGLDGYSGPLPAINTKNTIANVRNGSLNGLDPFPTPRVAAGTRPTGHPALGFHGQRSCFPRGNLPTNRDALSLHRADRTGNPAPLALKATRAPPGLEHLAGKYNWSKNDGLLGSDHAPKTEIQVYTADGMNGEFSFSQSANTNARLGQEAKTAVDDANQENVKPRKHLLRHVQKAPNLRDLATSNSNAEGSTNTVPRPVATSKPIDGVNGFGSLPAESGAKEHQVHKDVPFKSSRANKIDALFNGIMGGNGCNFIELAHDAGLPVTRYEKAQIEPAHKRSPNTVLRVGSDLRYAERWPEEPSPCPLRPRGRAKPVAERRGGGERPWPRKLRTPLRNGSRNAHIMKGWRAQGDRPGISASSCFWVDSEPSPVNGIVTSRGHHTEDPFWSEPKAATADIRNKSKQKLVRQVDNVITSRQGIRQSSPEAKADVITRLANHGLRSPITPERKIYLDDTLAALEGGHPIPPWMSYEIWLEAFQGVDVSFSDASLLQPAPVHVVHEDLVQNFVAKHSTEEDSMDSLLPSREEFERLWNITKTAW